MSGRAEQTASDSGAGLLETILSTMERMRDTARIELDLIEGLQKRIEALENGVPDGLTYFGPDRHAPWCPGERGHGGACLDVMLAKIEERADV